MARSSEQAGLRLRAVGGRCRAGLGRHRGHLLVGLVLTDLTLATLAEAPGVVIRDRRGR